MSFYAGLGHDHRLREAPFVADLFCAIHCAILGNEAKLSAGVWLAPTDDGRVGNFPESDFNFTLILRINASPRALENRPATAHDRDYAEQGNVANDLHI